MASYNNQLASGGDDSSPETPEDGSEPDQRDDTFFLPSDYPGAENLKPGDMVSLKVVGKDADGNIEVECPPENMKDGKGGDWKSDLNNLDKEMA